VTDADFRFVVGDPDARSSSWRAWVASDGSFYVSPREMKGAVKVSLHPPRDGDPDSGWFFGFTREFALANQIEPLGHTRLERFHVEPRAPGITRACTIRIHSTVVNWNRPLRRARQHIWIPRPAEGMATEIVFCVITDPMRRDVNATRVVGELTNERGVRLLAFSREARVSERVRLSGDMGPHATDTDVAQVRAMVMGTLGEDGSVVLEEVAGERR
jgi:hypothetical protein